jgi:hypothetical protein
MVVAVGRHRKHTGRLFLKPRHFWPISFGMTEDCVFLKLGQPLEFASWHFASKKDQENALRGTAQGETEKPGKSQLTVSS